MIDRTLDIYAMTNPSFCTTILWSYILGYTENDHLGCEYPLAFLPIPLLLSKQILKTFDGTNVRTGFMHWILENQNILVDIAKRIELTSDYTRQAILFGTKYDLFVIKSEGRILVEERINTSKLKSNYELNHLVKISSRLGRWVGEVKSTKEIFYSLGVTL